mmetsp:Transcript_47536/g.148689  ORF Transcript_47536/g.148689 Transcript_47536/m.148689 type:complete len:363 (+) Transcript_47536:111-1199(+)
MGRVRRGPARAGLGHAGARALLHALRAAPHLRRPRRRHPLPPLVVRLALPRVGRHRPMRAHPLGAPDPRVRARQPERAPRRSQGRLLRRGRPHPLRSRPRRCRFRLGAAGEAGRGPGGSGRHRRRVGGGGRGGPRRGPARTVVGAERAPLPRQGPRAGHLCSDALAVEAARRRLQLGRLCAVRDAELQRDPHPLRLGRPDRRHRRLAGRRVARVWLRAARPAAGVGVAGRVLCAQAAGPLLRRDPLPRLLAGRRNHRHRRRRLQGQALVARLGLLLCHFRRAHRARGRPRLRAARPRARLRLARRHRPRLRPAALPQLPDARHADARPVRLRRRRPVRRDRVRRLARHVQRLRVEPADGAFA